MSQAGSKREQRKAETRQQILQAAVDEFVDQGFAASRLDNVAGKAGVAKGTIYLYFDSKESLFTEVVRKYLSPAVEEAVSFTEEFEGSASELLVKQLQHCYEILSRDRVPQIVSLIMGEGARFPALGEFVYREIISRQRSNISKAIQAGVASGEFRATRADEFTQLVMAPALISAIWSIQYNQLSPLDIEAFARAHVDLLLNGLKA